jgi:hypothetical protein
MPPGWKQTQCTGAGGERAGCARSQGFAPTLARPRWGREALVPGGVAVVRWCRWRARRRRALPGSRPHPCPPPLRAGSAGAGRRRCRALVQVASAPEARSQGDGPHPAPPPLGAGSVSRRRALVQVASAPEARAPRGMAPTLTRPRWGREARVLEGAAGVC